MLKKLNRTTANIGTAPQVRILQFGEGNFLRAFADWIVDILNEQTGFNAGIQIVQPISQGLIKKINEQEGLYHVVLKGLQGGKETTQTRLIKSIHSCINPYEDFDNYLKAAANPGLRFVISNTTEAGITFDPTDNNPSSLASTFPGKVTQLLLTRFKAFNGDATRGLIFLPCELIEKNGDALKKTVLEVAALWNLPSAFVKWVNEANTFCNTLVDRIVTGYPRDTINEIHQSIGYQDELVVQAEPFHLWVIDGPSFVRKEFPADQAGLQVKFVDDITPYRTRKVRILNGAHTALVPVAYLAGLRTVRESVDDPAIGRYIRNTVFSEILPTLDLPHEELNHFANDVLERFQNPYIRHELISIALNSVSKWKVRVLPSLVEYQKRTGELPKNLAYSLAALIMFYKGSWNDDTIPLNDSSDVLEFFKNSWASDDPGMVAGDVLSATNFWGQDLSSIAGLRELVTKFLKQIYDSRKLPAH